MKTLLACFAVFATFSAAANLTNVNVGLFPNDSTGDPLRNAFIKC